jgi:hypothetical protein
MSNQAAPIKTWLNGIDVTDSLGASVSAQASTLENKEFTDLLQGEAEILSLRDSKDNGEYLSRYIKIVRKRQGVNPALYSQPRTPGLKGSISYMIRILLWRILRYQHFWLAFHQNAINAMHAETLDFEHQERSRQAKEMESRIDHLEEQLKALQEKS